MKLPAAGIGFTGLGGTEGAGADGSAGGPAEAAGNGFEGLGGIAPSVFWNQRFSMYLFLRNSLNFSKSVEERVCSLLYFAKYLALKAELPTCAKPEMSSSVNTLMEMPFTLNWNSRWIPEHFVQTNVKCVRST